MGFFDFRCMVSGLSLKGQDTALLLMKTNDPYSGVFDIMSLPVFGNYNRLGYIDCIQENAHTEHLLSKINKLLKKGDLQVDSDDFDGSEFADLEPFFSVVERGITEEHDAVAIDETRVVYALISKYAWDAMSSAATGHASSWAFLRDNCPDLKALYGSESRFEDLASQLEAAMLFVDKQKLSWKQPEDSCQDYATECAEYLAEAKKTFAGCAPLMAALSRYETEQAELLTEEGEDGPSEPKGGGSEIAEGAIVRGKVISISDDLVQLSVGPFESEVSTDEFFDVDGKISCRIDDVVDLYVDGFDGQKPIVSHQRAKMVMAWEQVSMVFEKKAVIEGLVLSRLKAGLKVDVGVAAFLPEGQVAPSDAHSLDALVGKKVRVRVIKFDRRSGEIVLSAADV